MNSKIRSDNCGELENEVFKFFNGIGIAHEFSAPRTPQQNGIVEISSRNSLNHVTCTFFVNLFLG